MASLLHPLRFTLLTRRGLFPPFGRPLSRRRPSSATPPSPGDILPGDLAAAMADDEAYSLIQKPTLANQDDRPDDEVDDELDDELEEEEEEEEEEEFYDEDDDDDQRRDGTPLQSVWMTVKEAAAEGGGGAVGE